MSYIDIIILIPILWGAYRGFTKGFVVAIASLAALFLGIMIAFYFSDILCDFMRVSLGWQSATTPFLSFAVLFVVVIILVHLLARGIEKLLKATALNWLNKMAGLVFGAAKWLLIISAVITLFQSIDAHISIIPKKEVKKSSLYPIAARTLPTLLPYVKESRLFIRQIRQEPPQE